MEKPCRNRRTMLHINSIHCTQRPWRTLHTDQCILHSACNGSCPPGITGGTLEKHQEEAGACKTGTGGLGCTPIPSHCTQHSVHCITFTAHCRLHTTQCTLHADHCILHTARVGSCPPEDTSGTLQKHQEGSEVCKSLAGTGGLCCTPIPFTARKGRGGRSTLINAFCTLHAADRALQETQAARLKSTKKKHELTKPLQEQAGYSFKRVSPRHRVLF